MSVRDRLKNMKKEVSNYQLVLDSIEELIELKGEYSYKILHKAFNEEHDINLSFLSFREYFRRAKRDSMNYS